MITQRNVLNDLFQETGRKQKIQEKIIYLMEFSGPNCMGLPAEIIKHILEWTNMYYNFQDERISFIRSLRREATMHRARQKKILILLFQLKASFGQSKDVFPNKSKSNHLS